MSELARRAEGPRSIQHVDTGALMQAALDKGPEGVAALEKLVQLHEHQQEREFRRAFISAFARVREKTTVINASKAMPGKNGSVRWYYAPLEDLQDEVEPILRSEGLELRFNSRRDGPQANIVIAICIIMDPETGYSETAECGVNAANAEGGDLGAFKKAKRGALTAMLGIRTRHDDDARMLGDLISGEQAAELHRRVVELRVDERKFLAFALGCNPADVDLDRDGQEERCRSWKQIRQGRIGQLHELLNQKERTGATGRTPAKPAAGGSTARAAPAATAEPAAPGEPTPEEQAAIQAQEWVDGQSEDDLRKYLIGLPGPALNRAMKAAGVKTISGAPESVLRAVAFQAKSNL